MHLVDTSVLIDFFKRINNPAVEYFNNLLIQQSPFAITGVIYQEVLQGVKTETDYALISKYLSVQRFVHPKDPVETYEQAAKLYRSCRRKGITIRGTIDCFIAQLAIENNFILLHNDKDFEYMQKVQPLLKLVPKPQ